MPGRRTRRGGTEPSWCGSAASRWSRPMPLSRPLARTRVGETAS
ncbi:hypothetical protein STTU_6249 [Streptomyces sp. Tu6071]|nr:hypothetical protein STTU_6249 [Streptomyces sp. Tu6071]